MPFIEVFKTWLDKVEADSCARIAARTAQAQATLAAKAASSTALDSVVFQLRKVNTGAVCGNCLQVIIVLLLLLILNALMGVIITTTPALANERDKYVTPIVKKWIDGQVKHREEKEKLVEDVKDITSKAVSAVKTKLTPFKTKVEEIQTTIMAKFENIKVNIVAMYNEQFNTQVKDKTTINAAAETQVGAVIDTEIDTSSEAEVKNQDDDDEYHLIEVDSCSDSPVVASSTPFHY
jgi:hypothetical protein